MISANVLAEEEMGHGDNGESVMHSLFAMQQHWYQTSLNDILRQINPACHY